MDLSHLELLDVKPLYQGDFLYANNLTAKDRILYTFNIKEISPLRKYPFRKSELDIKEYQSIWSPVLLLAKSFNNKVPKLKGATGNLDVL